MGLIKIFNSLTYWLQNTSKNNTNNTNNYRDKALDILYLWEINSKNSEILTTYLTDWFKVTPLVWNANKNNWVKIRLQNWWVSKSDFDKKIIYLWTGKAPPEIKQILNFESEVPKDFIDEFVKKYIFSHENAHFIAWYLIDNLDRFTNFWELCKFVENLRKTWKAISRLWNIDFYSDPKKKKEEDIVELINMYCINPKLLKSYLDSLVNWEDEFLEKDNLKRLDSRTANYIFEIISDSVSRFLLENKIIDEIIKD